MKHVTLASGLSGLCRILKAAIDHCNAVPDAPAEIRSAVKDHSLSCPGIEEVIELVGKSTDRAISAAHNCQLLEQHLHAAEAASSDIQNATTTYRNARFGLKAKRAAARHREFTERVLSNFSFIVTALNYAILLVSIRLNNDHTGILIAKLHSLIASCQKADGFPQRLAHTAVNCASNPQSESHHSNDTEVQELLQPSNFAYVLSELHAVHAHAGASAFGAALPPRNAQLLDINLLSLLLGRQPLHPPNVIPTLVSYHSEVIVATRAGDHQRLSQILNDLPGLLYCFTIDNLTLMSFAIESGEIKTVRHLLQKGIGVNDTYGRNETCPLATALQFRHLRVARLLIHAGAKFDHKNKYGWSPLFYIWFKEDRSTSAGPLLGLLAASTTFHVMHRNVYDKDGWSVMHRAAIYGTSQDISTLLQLGVDPFSVSRSKTKNPFDGNIHNYSVLRQVVLDGLADIVKVLLPEYRKRFGNIDLPDERGWTLLHVAIEKQHLAIIQLLVENDADIWAMTKPTSITRDGETIAGRYTPFSLALSFGPQFLDYFIRTVRKHQQLSKRAVQTVKKHLCDPHFSVLPPARWMPAPSDERARISHHPALTNSKELKAKIEHGKVFGGATVSDNASVHMGDCIHYYHNTYNNLGGRYSKAKLRRLRLREKLSPQARHITRKKILNALP